MRPSREQVLMDTAELVSQRSTCSRKQVGCVIARDGRQLTSGYNGAPAGLPHCSHVGDDPCTNAVHAEANAVAYAARYGMALEGAELYTTLAPCLACAQLIINAGIRSVYYGAEYRDQSGLNLLIQAGIVMVG